MRAKSGESIDERKLPMPAGDNRILATHVGSLIRPAGLAGRENLQAGTDCGFAQSPGLKRVHEEVMRAKLGALVDGARLASKALWGARAA
jgi:methionine synthase II (cobalamin-independent)